MLYHSIELPSSRPVTIEGARPSERLESFATAAELSDALFAGSGSLQLQRRWTIIRDIETIAAIDDPRVAVITEALRSNDARQSLLEALTHETDIIRCDPLRARMLRTLVDVVPDTLIFKFAAQSLAGERPRHSIDIAEPAIRILSHLTRPYGRLRAIVFEAARSLTPDPDDHGGAAALALLKGWGLPAEQIAEISELTHEWYRRYPGRMNPWLEYLTQEPTDHGVVTAAMILMGAVPYEELSQYYKKVAYDSMLSGAASKLMALSAQVVVQPPLWVAMNLFGVATLISSGYSWLRHRSEFCARTEEINSSRVVERMQAALCLDRMATVCEERGAPGDRYLRRLIGNTIVSAHDCCHPREVQALLERIIERGNPPGYIEDLWSFDRYNSPARRLELPRWS